MNHPSKIVRYGLISVCLAWMAATPLLRAQTREETSLWESIKDSKDAEDYKGYLDKYPEGTYAPVAKRRVAQLEAHPSEQTPDAQSGTKKDLSAVQAPSKSQAAVPVTMTECEGTNNCTTWTFLGTQGNGQWPSGEIANLRVEHFDADTVVIRRADSTGSSAGLTAVYKGTRHGDRIGGEFTSSWPGRWDNKSGNWYATIGKAAESLPSVMHFCAQHCATLIWDNGHYVIPGAYGGNGSSIWTVESFTRESVILDRADSNGFTGFYKGQISSEGNRLVNAVSASSRSSLSNPDGNTRFNSFKLTWGTALDSIPGSDGPAPVVSAWPVVCYPWFFGIVCSQ
jgi:hypothetical protein